MTHNPLYEYFKNIDDFVQNVCITLVGKRGLHITFQFLSYDLIDQELDFNEEYYKDMRINIVNVLINECKKLTSDYDRIDIFHAITVMSKMSKMDQHVIITNDSTSITKFKGMF